MPNERILPNRGQQTMANSEPVVIASDQSAVPISGTVTVDTSLLATKANQTNATQKTQVVDSSGNSIDSLSAGTGMRGLMIAIGATNYVLSTVNSSTVQLAAGAKFTGAIESIFNEPNISILLTSDQNGLLTINQYIDVAGTYRANQFLIPIIAGVPLSKSFTLNGNYANIVFENQGNATTTTFNLNVAYGTIPEATNLNNEPTAINEINGYVVDSNSGNASNGTQRMILATTQPETTSDATRRQYLEKMYLADLMIANISQYTNEKNSAGNYGYELR